MCCPSLSSFHLVGMDAADALPAILPFPIERKHVNTPEHSHTYGRREKQRKMRYKCYIWDEWNDKNLPFDSHFGMRMNTERHLRSLTYDNQMRKRHGPRRWRRRLFFENSFKAVGRRFGQWEATSVGHLSHTQKGKIEKNLIKSNLFEIRNGWRNHTRITYEKCHLLFALAVAVVFVAVSS